MDNFLMAYWETYCICADQCTYYGSDLLLLASEKYYISGRKPFKKTRIQKFCMLLLFNRPTWMSGGQGRAGRCSWSPWMSEAQGWPLRGRRPGWRRARCVSRPGARSATGSCTGPPAKPNMKVSIYFMYRLIVLYKGRGGGGGGRALLPSLFPPPPGRSEFTLSRWGREGVASGQSEFTLSRWGREGRGERGKGRAIGRGVSWKSHKTHYMQNRIQITEYSWSKTHLHKITNVPVFDMALVLNDFDGANPWLGPLEGVGLENPKLFWAQRALKSLVAISGLKKVSIFRAHPFRRPSKWICPPSKSLRSAPYKQQVIDKLQCRKPFGLRILESVLRGGGGWYRGYLPST